MIEVKLKVTIIRQTRSKTRCRENRRVYQNAEARPPGSWTGGCQDSMTDNKEI